MCSLDEAALVSVEGDPSEAMRWSLEAIDVGPGYAAALAVEGPPPEVRLWDWRIGPKEPLRRPS